MKVSIKTIFITLGVLIFIGTAIFLYLGTQMVDFVGGLGECGVSGGPYYGEEVIIKLDTIRIDEYLDYPNGKFAVANQKDTLIPILIKLDKSNNVLWAVKLNSTDSTNQIPMKKMENLKLSENEEVKRIDFFNKSYSEPGTIYLTNEYNFEYMCLSPL